VEEKKVDLLPFSMFVFDSDFHHLFLNKNISIDHWHHAIHWKFSNRKDYFMKNSNFDFTR
jgi:hypothetical protein